MAWIVLCSADGGVQFNSWTVRNSAAAARRNLKFPCYWRFLFVLEGVGWLFTWRTIIQWVNADEVGEWGL